MGGEFQFWDEESASFDEEVDHGLRDPAVRAAWAGLLWGWIPEGSVVLDAGCGTGSLSAVVSEFASLVVGVDGSWGMVGRAAAKLDGSISAKVVAGDVVALPFRPGCFDVVVCRHVLWAVPDPRFTLAGWARLVRPGGRLVLVEGRWSSGAGLSSPVVVNALPDDVVVSSVVDLASRPELWGRVVDDERYAVVADRVR